MNTKTLFTIWNHLKKSKRPCYYCTNNQFSQYKSSKTNLLQPLDSLSLFNLHSTVISVNWKDVISAFRNVEQDFIPFKLLRRHQQDIINLLLVVMIYSVRYFLSAENVFKLAGIISVECNEMFQFARLLTRGGGVGADDEAQWRWQAQLHCRLGGPQHTA